MEPGRKLAHIKGVTFVVRAVWVQGDDNTVGVEILNPDTGECKYMSYVRLIQLMDKGDLKFVD